jgi:nicotinamidase-related amidase
MRSFLEAVNPEQIVVYSVASDICIDLTGRLLAEAMGYELIVASDAIKGIDSKRIKECMDEWHSLGVSLRKTEEIIGASKE